MQTVRAVSCAIGVLYLVTSAVAPRLFAADPPGAAISFGAPTAAWGGSFVASNPVTCFSVIGIDPACDRFRLAIEPPAPGLEYVVTIRVAAANASDTTFPTDDIDLFVRNPDNETIAVSGTAGGVEEIVLRNPPGGTYTIVVQPFLVFPAPTAAYAGVAEIAAAPADERSNAYHGARYTPDFLGVPESRAARSSPLVAELKATFTYVGRRAAEPTIGINANGTAFYAAADFDFPAPVAPTRLARTVVLRSRDKGTSWQPVAGFALSEESIDEPPFTLDPMIHVDRGAGLVDPLTGRRMGRVFSVDLVAACGAQAVFSDDEGETWTSRPGFGCSTPVNDHHTIVTARPPAGLTTIGYPNLLYFCFNRVSDSSCARSHDGGDVIPFAPAGTAFTGVDPDAGSFCGGLHGHLAADRDGRIFLPKGHCGLPWIAISDNGGGTWNRVRITGHTAMEDHEVSLAVDTADNIYAVWQGPYRLPYLSISRDHGLTWSTPIMIAPPGVHEVNFPAIVAGDPGRIAVLFPGSESTDFGNAETDDETRPWNIYIVMSVDALKAVDPAGEPTFTWTIANPKRDPVHRGTCGPGRCDADDGGSMFDFLDIQVGPDGMFWGTASDTCVGACVTDPTAQKVRPGEGVAIRQTKGPLLFIRP